MFGEKHEITKMTREWGWWWHVHEKRNPYPLQDGSYDYNALAKDNRAMAEYVAERTMDQACEVCYYPLLSTMNLIVTYYELHCNIL